MGDGESGQGGQEQEEEQEFVACQTLGDDQRGCVLFLLFVSYETRPDPASPQATLR